MANETFLRILLLFLCAAVLPVKAQPWHAYANPEYRFAINFPAQPADEAISYTASDGAMLGARRFTARYGEGRFSVTVVPFPRETFRPDSEIRHAVRMLGAAGEIQYRGQAYYGSVPGEDITVLLPSGRRIVAAVLAHASYLHIVEGETAPGAEPPQPFVQSIMLIDAYGEPVELDH